jgi:hypothetical protein
MWRWLLTTIFPTPGKRSGPRVIITIQTGAVEAALFAPPERPEPCRSPHPPAR